ncbi:MAG: phosphoribosylanthranilate isomerase [Acidimicrobiia bacterium]|nr:phosphoribosylanthranilate isomerase [Acidimicrobiia bacterium]
MFPASVPGRVQVKICGLRDPDHARLATRLGVDAIGFVRHPASPRHVDLGTARELTRVRGPDVCAVAVTVSPEDGDVEVLVTDVGVDVVQVHGSVATPSFARWRRAHPETVFVRALRFAPQARWPRLDPAGAHAVLVDTAVEGSMGGTGVHLAWQRARSDVPVILAGGLTPANVGGAIEAVRPQAVDVSSGVESSPGEKDPVLMEAFVEAVHRTARTQA